MKNMKYNLHKPDIKNVSQQVSNNVYSKILYQATDHVIEQVNRNMKNSLDTGGGPER